MKLNDCPGWPARAAATLAPLPLDPPTSAEVDDVVMTKILVTGNIGRHVVAGFHRSTKDFWV